MKTPKTFIGRTGRTSYQRNRIELRAFFSQSIGLGPGRESHIMGPKGSGILELAIGR